MSSSRRWTRVAVAVLSVLATLAGLQAAGLLVFGLRGAPTLVLALVAAFAGGAAGQAARLLRRGRLARVRGWLGLWALLVLPVLGLVGATFHAGVLFWGSALGAAAAWGLAGGWLAIRVRAEWAGGDAKPDAPALAGLGADGAGVASPNESLQLTEPRSVPMASKAPAARLRS